jgi:hypothetical protein
MAIRPTSTAKVIAISLAEARTRTFSWRRKIFIVSTPTIAGASADRARVRGQRPAPLLRAVPALRSSAVAALRAAALGEGAIPRPRPTSASPATNRSPEHHKTRMLEHGEWRATAPANGKTAGFHLSSLYSPIGWRSWREIAAAWESAVRQESGSSAAIKTFKNTELGETWVEEGEAPDWQRLAGTSRGLSDRTHPGRRPAAGRWRRRAEGSHRSVDLGLWPRQGVLAHRAPRA